jgi:hypothetical protein
MRKITIPKQSSVAKAYAEFDEAGRMPPPSYYDRIIEVADALVRSTMFMHGHAEQLVDRCSGREDRQEPVVTPHRTGTVTQDQSGLAFCHWDGWILFAQSCIDG